MTRQQHLRNQADQANSEAIEGGIDGGIRWFLGGVIVFGTAQLVWPAYRGLTVQFKVRLNVHNNNRHFCYPQVRVDTEFSNVIVTATGAILNAERRCFFG
jgi:hypothetical protein